jgi:hypothetical protein
VYDVEWENRAREDVRALPPEALIPFAELVTLLEVGPWGGRLLKASNPDANMLTHPFGGYGLATYLVLEGQRRVVVLQVAWAG